MTETANGTSWRAMVFADCCGTCGLCWATDKNIIFLAH